MRFIILAAFFCISSGKDFIDYHSSKVDCDTFLLSFKESILPFEITIDSFQSISKNRVQIDSIDLIKFDSSVQSNCNIYAISKVLLPNNYIGLIYEMEFAAGGVNSIYYLMLLDEKCKMVYKTKCAQFTGDCSFLVVQNCLFDDSLKLKFHKLKYTIDCDSEEITQKNESTELIDLNPFLK